MDVRDFHFDLPEERIAQHPLSDRDMSRLLVLDREGGEISHRSFRDIVSYLGPGDCLVLNNTKVIPARLFGDREDSGAKVEILLLRRVESISKPQSVLWETLVRPGKKARPGVRILFGGGRLTGEVESVGEGGVRHVRFFYEGVFEEIIDKIGHAPLPPYIHEQLADRDRYQTVYAKEEGSAAAPTAGLHFTRELLSKVAQRGVNIAEITLHVGLGTFRPVKVDRVEEHQMHSEYYHIAPEAADMMNAARESKGRLVCVGTTACRTVETAADEGGRIRAGGGMTDIFIYPGYRFRATDALITNFHLPESTLLMLVSALAGRERVLSAYREAIRAEYRFFSFGDAMLIL